MRIVLQRVSTASVVVGREVVGAIDRGLLLLVGVQPDDDHDTVRRAARKIVGVRVFECEAGRMNRDIRDVDGELLLVPQFTLAATTAKGNRPSFGSAAPPEYAEVIFGALVDEVASSVRRVETGQFGATMSVRSSNEGPVTFVLDLS